MTGVVFPTFARAVGTAPTPGAFIGLLVTRGSVVIVDADEQSVEVSSVGTHSVTMTEVPG
jgi:hypothetical protein